MARLRAFSPQEEKSRSERMDGARIKRSAGRLKTASNQGNNNHDLPNQCFLQVALR